MAGIKSGIFGRVLSIVLAGAMVIGMVPTAALAEAEESVDLAPEVDNEAAIEELADVQPADIEDEQAIVEVEPMTGETEGDAVLEDADVDQAPFIEELVAEEQSADGNDRGEDVVNNESEDVLEVITEDGEDEGLAEEALVAQATVLRESEPNDSIDKANTISLNKYYYATSKSSSDQDFYKITITASGRYKLSFAADNQLSTGFWGIHVYDFDRNSVFHDSSGPSCDDLARSEFEFYLPAGIAYVEVYCSHNVYAGAAYHLRLATDSFLPTDSTDFSSFKVIGDSESEDNGKITSPNLMALNGYVYAQSDSGADQDFYAYNITRAGRYKLSFAADNQLSNGFWGIHVYDFDRNSVFHDSSGPSCDNLARSEFEFYLPVGAAYVEVYCSHNVYAGAAYHLRLCGALFEDASVSGIKSSYAYTGKAITPKPTVKMGATTLQLDTHYTLSYSNNVKAGTATITIKGKGGYVGTKKVTFKIVKAIPLSKCKVASVGAKAYTGKAIKPSPKVTYGGKTLKKGTDYTLSYKNNKKIGVATITIKGKGKYTGTRTVKFRIRFKDVPTDHWAYAKVHKAVDANLIQGYSGSSEGYFGPSDNLTRGQVAVMLWRMAGKPSSNGGSWFWDVDSGAFYYDAVIWAADRGVVNGYSYGRYFGPDDNVTREQLAVMLANYQKNVRKKGVSGSKWDYYWDVTDDANVSSWAEASVGWCYRKGIMPERPGYNNVRAQENATRAETAAMLYALYKLK